MESETDSFGRLAVTEANALGTPAVAYDVPGLRDSVLDGRTGLLVPFRSITQLANGALRLLRDESYRRALAENGLEWARQFNWNATAQSFMSVTSTCK